jgi:hypothetical protein
VSTSSITHKPISNIGMTSQATKATVLSGRRSSCSAGVGFTGSARCGSAAATSTSLPKRAWPDSQLSDVARAVPA